MNSGIWKELAIILSELFCIRL